MESKKKSKRQKSLRSRWFKRLKKAGTELLFKDSNPRNGSGEKLYQRHFDLLNEVGVSEDDIFIDKPLVLERIADYGGKFRLLGEEDGKSGQSPSAVNNIARNKAQQWRAFLEAAFLSQKASAELKEKELNEQYTKTKDDHNLQKEYYQRLEESYRWDYRRFLLPLGLFYLLISIFLIIADVPLSIRLTSEGFDIPPPDFERDGFSAFFSQGMVLSLGIVLITIFVKVFYDEYLGEPIEKSVTRFKRKNLPGFKQGVEEDHTDDVSKVRGVWWGRLGIKSFILSTVVITLITLGVYREDEAVRVAKQELEKEKLVLINPNLFNPTSDSEKRTLGDWFDHEISNLQSSKAKQLSFILLTLLFPVIGGICASLGLDKVQNALELKRALHRLHRRAELRDQAMKKWIKAKNQVRNYESYLSWCGNDSKFIDDQTNFFFSCYLHGYEKGMRENMPEDLFEFAELVRSRFMAMKASDMLTKSLTNELISSAYRQLPN